MAGAVTMDTSELTGVGVDATGALALEAGQLNSKKYHYRWSDRGYYLECDPNNEPILTLSYTLN